MELAVQRRDEALDEVDEGEAREGVASVRRYPDPRAGRFADEDGFMRLTTITHDRIASMMASRHFARGAGTLSDPGLVTPSRRTLLDDDSLDSPPSGFAGLSPQVRKVLDRNKR